MSGSSIRLMNVADEVLLGGARRVLRRGVRGWKRPGRGGVEVPSGGRR